MDFAHSHAVVIGIDAYSGGIPPLRSARADAEALARELEANHGYRVLTLVDGEASRERLVRLLEQDLPASVGDGDRLLIYFAGHGIAQDGDDGPEGFVVPADAAVGDPSGLLSMVQLHDDLAALPCRHLLLVLDCCFAGSFRWAATRGFLPSPVTLYRKRFERFLADPAWQVLTSASDDQTALDTLESGGLGTRGAVEGHSPFASALIDGLRGAADRPGPDGQPDGVVTATELYLHLRDVVELETLDLGMRQTPGLWPLRKHGRGEFLFRVPGREPNLREDPRLDEAANPWLGLRAYSEETAHLFFGRQRVVAELRARLEGAEEPLLAVVGASGTGKSSCVNGGLVPALVGGDGSDGGDVGPAWQVIGPLRPGSEPARVLETAQDSLARASEGSRRLLVIDQFEELFTQCRDPEERTAFLAGVEALIAGAGDGLRVVITLRSGFELHLQDTPLGPRLRQNRYVVPPMTREELRQVVTAPAELKVLYFEPPELVDRIVDEVAAMPGGLPLLSFSLSELYRAYLRRDATDRALTGEDHEAMGGVSGSLRSRADELFQGAAADERRSIRRLMLRMVATEGGELARRRVFARELVYAEEAETARLRALVERFVHARLLVSGTLEPTGDREGEGGGAREDGSGVLEIGGTHTAAESYVEPAHDMLVLGWRRLHRWLDEASQTLPVVRAAGRAAAEWEADGRQAGLLWNDDPRLPLLEPMAGDGGGGGSLNLLEERFVRASVRRRAALARRRNWIAIAVVTVLSAIALFAVYKAVEAGHEARRADQQAVQTEKMAEQAIAEKTVAVQRAAVANARLLLALSRDAHDSDLHQRSLLLAGEAADRLGRRGLPVLGEVEQWLRERVAATPGIGIDQQRTSRNRLKSASAMWSPDGAWLAISMRAGPYNSSYAESRQWICRLADGQESVCEPQTGSRAFFSPYGPWLLTLAEWPPTVDLYLLPDEGPAVRVAQAVEHPGWAFTTDGRYLCAGLDDGASGAAPIVHALPGRAADPLTMLEPAESDALAPARAACLAERSVLDPEVSEIDVEWPPPIEDPLARADDPWHLVTGDGDLAIRRTSGGAPVVLLTEAEGQVRSAAVSRNAPVGAVLHAGDARGRISRWSLDSWPPREIGPKLTGHETAVNALFADPTGRWLVSVSDWQVRLWDHASATADDHQPLGHLRVVEPGFVRRDHGPVTLDRPVGPVAFAADGSQLAALAADGQLVLWSRDGQGWTRRDLGLAPADANAVSFGRTGRWVVTWAVGGSSPGIAVADLDETAPELRPLPSPPWIREPDTHDPVLEYGGPLSVEFGSDDGWLLLSRGSQVAAAFLGDDGARVSEPLACAGAYLLDDGQGVAVVQHDERGEQGVTLALHVPSEGKLLQRSVMATGLTSPPVVTSSTPGVLLAWDFWHPASFVLTRLPLWDGSQAVGEGIEYPRQEVMLPGTPEFLLSDDGGRAVNVISQRWSRQLGSLVMERDLRDPDAPVRERFVDTIWGLPVLDPQGRWLARIIPTGSSPATGEPASGYLEMWDLDADTFGTRIELRVDGDPFERVAIAGGRLFAATVSGAIWSWDLDATTLEGAEILLAQPGTPVEGLFPSQDGTHLVVLDRTGAATLITRNIDSWIAEARRRAGRDWTDTERAYLLPGE